MSDGNSSTLGSYVNAATGATQRAVGSLTGNSSTQAQGEAAKAQSEAQSENSHTTAKVGPVAADPNTGATATDNANRSTGSWDQTVGSAKESIGNLTGIESLRQAGVEQNAAGKEQEAKGQLKDFGEGLQNRAQGTVGGLAAAITGDREDEQKYKDIHDEGKVRQRGAEADMAKRQGA
ncbi:hypothetical protein N7478_001797 [Penicillium angulare]|uniref:uncharacterized protein n=1 Tax=Penicillium angulare TaxID=116970 RepID=UPI00253FF83B|nr:uncharacterized protein N7478_001797 [Penicillium angulare]KAJ5288767.1 hypothetical protein N7478_001797 [Penicillium angulare]